MDEVYGVSAPTSIYIHQSINGTLESSTSNYNLGDNLERNKVAMTLQLLLKGFTEQLLRSYLGS